MEKVLTYVYYRWTCTTPMGVIGMQADRFIQNFHKMVNCGFSENVTYAGRLMTTCGGTDKAGEHYGFVIEADVDTTKRILDLIDADIVESFDWKTNEKLSKELETFNEWLNEIMTA